MIETGLDLLRTLMNGEKLLALLSSFMGGIGGYLLLFGIVFAETGLLVGFFLPGDSLLFLVGVLAGAGQLNVAAIILLLIVAAVTGDAVGYWLGKRLGTAVYNRPDSLLFKKKHLQHTREFYEKHGGKTIIYARFVPIVRTFAPFVAGVAHMPYRRFFSFNLFGGIGWVTLMVLLGYVLGQNEVVKRHFEKVIFSIILLSLVPVGVEYLRARRRAAVESASLR